MAAAHLSEGPPPEAGRRWSTSCLGDSCDTTPMELTVLGEHVSACRATRSRLSGLQHVAQVVHGLVASRFVTTMVLLLAMLGAALLVL